MLTVYYKVVFAIPAAASGVLLWACWRRGILGNPYPFGLWYLVAVVVQFSAGFFSLLWAIGLILQVVLAVVLSIKWKLA